MLISKVAIIILTHERHHVLRRAIDYYKSWNCTIIITDSSKEPFNDILPDNISYMHFPEKAIGYKLYQASLMVDSEYTCISPDDDFLAKYALIQGVQYLENNQEYASVSGNIINFKKSKNKLHIRPVTSLLESQYGFQVNSDVISDRVNKAIGRQHEYALHRTFLMQKCMKVVRNIEAVTPFHYTLSFLPMLYGKHATLPLFWQARDLDRYSNYFPLDGEEFYIKEQKSVDMLDLNLNFVVISWPKYLQSLDGKLYRDNFILECKNISKSKINCEDIFDAAFNKVSKDHLSQRSALKSIVKRKSPVFIWNLYTLFRDSELMSTIKRSRCKNKEGYPWSDSCSKSSWLEMSRVIEKYKILSQFKV